MGVRNVARYAQAPIPAEPGAKSNAAIALELLAAIATARGGLGTVLGAATGVYGKLLHSGRVLDLLLRLGPHHLSLKQLKASLHGLDLGPLEPRLSQVLYTRDGRIPLIPALLEPDLERLDRLLQAPEALTASAGVQRLRRAPQGS